MLNYVAPVLLAFLISVPKDFFTREKNFQWLLEATKFSKSSLPYQYCYLHLYKRMHLKSLMEHMREKEKEQRVNIWKQNNKKIHHKHKAKDPLTEIFPGLLWAPAHRTFAFINFS